MPTINFVGGPRRERWPKVLGPGAIANLAEMLTRALLGRLTESFPRARSGNNQYHRSRLFTDLAGRRGWLQKRSMADIRKSSAEKCQSLFGGTSDMKDQALVTMRLTSIRETGFRESAEANCGWSPGHAD